MSEKLIDPIFVIGIDYGSEGKQAPITYCSSEDHAQELKKLIERFHGSAVYIAEVPRWPGLAPTG